MVEEKIPRTAAERWLRLKSLYPIHESPAATHRAADSESSRSAPEVFETSFPNTPRRPALPVMPIDDEPSWVLPAVPDLAKPESKADFLVDEADNASVHRFEPVDRDRPPPRLERDNFAPFDDDVIAPPQRKAAVQEISTSAMPSMRQVSQKQMSLTPIAPVKYRKIGLISPFRERTDDGREIDHEIRTFARQQSDEVNLVFGSEPFPERAFPQMMKPWEAPNFFHYPLYFEDPALERYGHMHSPLGQVLISVGRFSTQLVCLPYQMTIDPPCREVYSLGWYRPGECAPKLHYQVPLNAKAAAVQAATVTGLVFLIP